MGNFLASLRRTNGDPSIAQTTIELAINTVTRTKDAVQFEPAKGVLESLGVLLATATRYHWNQNDLSDLAAQCQRVAEIVRWCGKENEMSEAESRLKRFIDETLKTITKQHFRSGLRKVFHMRGESEHITSLKDALREFIAQFGANLLHLNVELDSEPFSTDLNACGSFKVEQSEATDPIAVVREDLDERQSRVFSGTINRPLPNFLDGGWLESQKRPAKRQWTSDSFYTPPSPSVFFGRDDTVQYLVKVLVGEDSEPYGHEYDHVALIGAAGTGKSSLAKAIINEQAIVSAFHARLFIAYDDVGLSAMTYQLFLDRIASALRVAPANSDKIFDRLRNLPALLVIDNAEIFRQAGKEDAAKISSMINTLMTQPITRIVLISRNIKDYLDHAGFVFCTLGGIPDIP